MARHADPVRARAWLSCLAAQDVEHDGERDDDADHDLLDERGHAIRLSPLRSTPMISTPRAVPPTCRRRPSGSRRRSRRRRSCRARSPWPALGCAESSRMARMTAATPASGRSPCRRRSSGAWTQAGEARDLGAAAERVQGAAVRRGSAGTPSRRRTGR